MKILICFTVALAILFTACSSKKYGHYNKVKYKAVKTAAKKSDFEARKIAAETKQLPIVAENRADTTTSANNAISFTQPQTPLITIDSSFFTKRRVTLPINSNDLIQQPNDSAKLVFAPEKVNTNAKIAFWSAIGILGAGAAGVAFSSFFFFLIPVLALVAFIFGIVALRQIKRTGGYGKPKAEFALFVAIPFLIASILFGFAVLYILKSGIPVSITF